MSRIGVIDVGGGLRSIYGAGVLDWCMDHKIEFDHCIGVSAGSANVASYVSHQRSRNYRYYHNYAMRPEFVDLKARFTTGYACNVDYIYGTLSNEHCEDPYDYDAAMASPKTMLFVSTDARTGKPVYFSKNDLVRNNYFAFKASSNIPIVNKPWMVGDMPCYDGGISDPLPLRRAFRDGCSKVVVILTLPREQLLDPRKDRLWAPVLRKKYPKAAEALLHRSELYNAQLRYAKQCEAQGRVLILAPESIYGLGTLSQNAKKLDRLYRCGYKDAEAIPAFI